MRRAAVAVALVVLAGCVDRGPGPEPRKVDPSYVRLAPAAGRTGGVGRIGRPGRGGRNRSARRRARRQGRLPRQQDRTDARRAGPDGDDHALLEGARAHRRSVAGVRARPGPAGSPDFMNLDASDMQVGYGPPRWKAGDLIEDVQTFVVRPDWRSSSAMILVGLIEVGRHGTLDRMTASGPRTPDRAVVARVLEIDTSRAPPPPGTVHVPRAQGEITLDGIAAEPALEQRGGDGGAGACRGQRRAGRQGVREAALGRREPLRVREHPGHGHLQRVRAAGRAAVEGRLSRDLHRRRQQPPGLRRAPGEPEQRDVRLVVRRTAQLARRRGWDSACRRP